MSVLGEKNCLLKEPWVEVNWQSFAKLHVACIRIIQQITASDVVLWLIPFAFECEV